MSNSVSFLAGLQRSFVLFATLAVHPRRHAAPVRHPFTTSKLPASRRKHEPETDARIEDARKSHLDIGAGANGQEEDDTEAAEVKQGAHTLDLPECSMKRSGERATIDRSSCTGETTNNDDGVDNDYNGTDYNEYSDYSDHNDDEERGLTQQQPAPPAGTGRCTTGAPRRWCSLCSQSHATTRRPTRQELCLTVHRGEYHRGASEPPRPTYRSLVGDLPQLIRASNRREAPDPHSSSLHSLTTTYIVQCRDAFSVPVVYVVVVVGRISENEPAV